MQVGGIYIWERFPLHTDPTAPTKSRWFVYLGTTGPLQIHVSVFICTATTKLKHYGPGGSRQGHRVMRIQAGQYGFQQDCVIDVDIGTMDFPETIMTSRKSDINQMGQFQDQEMRQLWNLIRDSGEIPHIVKLDIRDSLQRSGLVNLKMPRSRH